VQTAVNIKYFLYCGNDCHCKKRKNTFVQKTTPKNDVTAITKADITKMGAFVEEE
jgi:hypothetical protein